MIYTEIAVVAVFAAVILDLYLLRTNLLRKKVFWTSYSIILPFQLFTNWWLTSRNIVMYSDDAIIGFRIASAPVEDLLFGFALVLSTMAFWVFWGRHGIGIKK
jgi:lycopene cyclase domain-containing protein